MGFWGGRFNSLRLRRREGLLPRYLLGAPLLRGELCGGKKVDQALREQGLVWDERLTHAALLELLERRLGALLGSDLLAALGEAARVDGPLPQRLLVRRVPGGCPASPG